MMNLLALSLVFSSLFAAQVWSPSSASGKHNHDHKEEDVIVKEGHRVIVVETYDQHGQPNTKVSISPPQDTSTAEHDKFPTDERGPRELVCDSFGKCTHKIARALGKAKDQVSDKAREAVAQQKELAHEAKEKVEDVYEKAKETASHKAHEAKQAVEDAYEKTKDSATHKAHDVKESAKQAAEDAYKKAKESTIHKARDVKETARESLNEAKETGKTIGREAARNVSERVDEVKESTGKAKIRLSTLFSHMGSTMGLNSLMGVVNLLGLATAYGMCVWVTFISSYVLAGALTRHQFGIVQSKIYAVYFRALTYCIGAALLGHVLRQRKKLFNSKAEMFQVYNLLASIVLVLINSQYLEPLATKVMFEKLKLEKEEGRGIEHPDGTGRAEAQPVTAAAPRAENPTEQSESSARLTRENERLKKLNSYSSLLNIVTLMALSWHLVYIGQNLHGTC